MRDRAPVTKSDQDRPSASRARGRAADPPMATVADGAPQAMPDFGSPVAFRRADVLLLQRTVGNRAVQRLLAHPPAIGRAPLTHDEDGGTESERAEPDVTEMDAPAAALLRSPEDDQAVEEADGPRGEEESVGGPASGPAELQRKPDPGAPAGGAVIQRAGRAQQIRDGLRNAGKLVGGGIVTAGKAVGKGVVTAGKAVGGAAVTAGKAIGKGTVTAGKAIGKGTVAAAKGVGKGAEYLTTVGIKDGTGVQSKAGKITGNIAEGLFNAMVGPVSPRWWYKAVSDIKGIKKSDYGAGKVARVFQGLAVTSQLVQKIGTVAGVLSLALGIAGAVLGSLMGAGAACALGSAVCGLIAFIASCTSFILQSVLTFGNLIKQGWTAIKSDPDKKKRFINDLTSMIGSAIGVIGGGLGVNWGGGGGLFNSGTNSVLEGATGGIASSGTLDATTNTVSGASSAGALVGQQFASFSMGQMFGSASDTVSETAGVLAAKHDPGAPAPASYVQREGEAEGPEGEGEGPNPEELKSGVSALLSALAESKDDDDKTADDMKGSLDAIDSVGETISKPMSATGVQPPPGGAPADLPVAGGVAMMPDKLDEAKKSLDDIETDVSKTGTYKKKDSAKLEKAGTDVEQAEEKLGISGEPAKKPSLFKRAKDWIVSKVLNLKTRIKKVAQAAKTKLVSVAMDVLGIKEQFEELKDTGAEDRQSNVDTIEEAAESSEAAEAAEEKAEEFSSTLG